MDIQLEQLVYGSFPFWDRGYDVLARSPGCQPVWAAEVLAACRRFGEAPAGVDPAPALFSIRLASGPRAIVGVEPQGVDDQGRPGALAFHALLVDHRDYRKAGSDPFAFAGSLRRDWSAESALTAISWTVEVPHPIRPSTDPRARRIVEALSKRRRVALESLEPIDFLARGVWSSLPESVRFRASVATWAFGNANRFDLVALPRLAGVELDRSYLDPTSIVAQPEPDADPSPPPSRRHLPHLGQRTLAVAGLAAVVTVGLGLAWATWRRPRPSPETPAPRSVVPEPTIQPDARARIMADLMALANRLELGEAKDLGTLMASLSDRYHYPGPILTPAELAKLTAEVDPDRDRALVWHERITRTFIDDRPLPGDFADLPLARQLDRLTWSFHLPPSLEPDAIPGALLEALESEGPISPTPLAARYPPLSDYFRFFRKLPRKSSR